MTVHPREVVLRALFSNNSETFPLEEEVEHVKYTPKEIKAYMDKFVISQEEPKKAIATLMVNHMIKAEYNEFLTLDTEKLKKSNILLLGNSGVGKTYIVKVAAEFVKIPFVTVDATKLTQEGYVGDSVDTILTQLYIRAGKDIHEAEKGIIFIDEFDKLSTSQDVRGDVSTGAVQQSLLKIVEGGVFSIPEALGGKYSTPQVEIDTTNITFIFAGAFGGITSKKEVKPGIGFSDIQQVQKVEDVEITEKDIIDYGIMPEMLGRIGNYVTLSDLTEDDMYKILTTSENSIIDQEKKLFELRGIKWKLKKKDYKNIIKNVMKTKLGARGIYAELAKLTKRALYEG